MRLLVCGRGYHKWDVIFERSTLSGVIIASWKKTVTMGELLLSDFYCSHQRKPQSPHYMHTSLSLFDVFQGFALKNQLLDTLNVESVIECTIHCLKHPSCQSINFKRTANPSHVCELNDKAQPEVALTSSNDFLYYGPSHAPKVNITVHYPTSFWLVKNNLISTSFFSKKSCLNKRLENVWSLYLTSRSMECVIQ